MEGLSVVELSCCELHLVRNAPEQRGSRAASGLTCRCEDEEGVKTLDCRTQS